MKLTQGSIHGEGSTGLLLSDPMNFLNEQASLGHLGAALSTSGNHATRTSHCRDHETIANIRRLRERTYRVDIIAHLTKSIEGDSMSWNPPFLW